MAFELSFPIGLMHRKLGHAGVFTEPLFFSEIARLADNRYTSSKITLEAVGNAIATLDTDEMIRRRCATAARHLNFTLELPPPRASEAWCEPVVLHFDAAVWDHGTEFVIARVPVLEIEVIATPKDDLTALLQAESLAVLRRKNLTTSLEKLSHLQTTTAFRVEFESVTVRLKSAKERANSAQTEDPLAKTALEQCALRLNPHRMQTAHEVDEVVRRLAEAMTAKPPQSVLLIGPNGVGKTAVFHELIRRAEEFQLAATAFFHTTGSRIVAGQSGFGMWEQRCQSIIKDAAKRRAVVHLGPLAELMDVGKSEFNPSGIASFLRPAIARGELLAVVECTPEQIVKIEKEDPQLTDAFRHITIDEPTVERGIRILERVAETIREHSLTPTALTTVDTLHRRYATYSAYPGRPLRFLENLIRDCPQDRKVESADVYHQFTRETGLPRPLIDPAVPLDLVAAKDWFSRRVVGQHEAVEIIIDLLATIKAGLMRANRPIASLMFIGPTGVGKTEMAKALAEFLFGSRDRLTRFDMSEYADPISVRRLVGTSFGTEGLLTAKVREQPFSVVLLDEIEKAHHSAFDLLLQVMGEARLTDAGGRLADFRNTLIILTSNLGAASFRSGTTGFVNTTGRDAKEHFTKAVEQALRPEMFNRLDRVVPFGSLSETMIRTIADREWQKLLVRDGIRFRELTLTSQPELLDYLANVGFDPQYGARPLKRAMERELLAPLSEQLNRHSSDLPITVTVNLEDGRPVSNVRPIPGAKPRGQWEPQSPVAKFVLQCQVLRRWQQQLEQSTLMREVENSLTQLRMRNEKLLRKQLRRRKLAEFDQETLKLIGREQELVDDVAKLRCAASELEDDAMVAAYSAASIEPLYTRLTELESQWNALLNRLYTRRVGTATRVSLVIFAESRTTRNDLALAHLAAATKLGFQVNVMRYRALGRHPERTTETVPAEWYDTHKATSFWWGNVLWVKGSPGHKRIMWREPLTSFVDEEDVIGIGLEIEGPGAFLRFSGEAGLHQFASPSTPDADTPHALVMVSPLALREYLPDERLARKGAINGNMVRFYIRDKGMAQDFLLHRSLTNYTNRFRR